MKPLGFDDRIDASRHIVSVSQFTMLARCEQQWVERYVHGIKDDFTPIFFVIGLSIDAAANAYNERFIDGRGRMQLDEFVDIAIREFDRQLCNGKVAFTEQDFNSPRLREEVEWMAEALWREVMCNSYPVSTQRKVEIPLGGGRSLIGYKDAEMKGVSGAIVTTDYKTAFRPWKEGKEDFELQPLVYGLDDMTTASLFTWEIIVRHRDERLMIPRKPTIESRHRLVSVEEKRAFRDIFLPKMLARMDDLRLNPEKALPTGYGSFVCGRGNCAHWKKCEIENGLKVR